MIVSLIAISLMVAAVAALTHYAPEPEKEAASYGSDASFVDSFAAQRFRPMLRLATQVDRHYLAVAHSRELAACYRKIQRSLLREYLRDATKDFNRLYAIAHAKCLGSRSDPENASTVLFEQHLTFILLVWGIEARLAVDGMLPFRLDLEPLIQSLEALARQTQELAQPRFGYHTA